MFENVSVKYKDLTNTMIKKAYTISTMESCTSGLIASLISDTEGSSKVLKGSFVSYCNEAKVMCGVNPNVIKEHGVYSKETSIEMAKTSKNKFNSDIAIGITGTFGNIDQNNKDSVIGHVDYTIIYFNEIYSYSLTLPTNISRLESKLYVANDIYDNLIKTIKA